MRILFILLFSPLFLKAQTQDTIAPYRIVLHYKLADGELPNFVSSNNDSSTITITVKTTTLLRAIFWAKHHTNDDGTQPYLNAKYIRNIQTW